MQQAARTANNVAEQGAVKASAFYDIAARVAIQSENVNVSPSLYSGAGDAGVWHIDPEELLFSVPGLQQSGDTRLLVLPTYAGLGAVASQLYPDDPEMVRQAVKNQIQYIGVAHQALRAEPGSIESGIAVQVGGLHTIKSGNGRYGDDSVSDNSIRPGTVLVAEVATAGPTGLLPAQGGRTQNGRSPNKYTLQARAADPRSAGQALLRHVREVVRNPSKWRMAMGEHLLGTNAWHTAAKAIIESYFDAVALAAGYLVNKGVLAVGPALVPAFGYVAPAAADGPAAVGDAVTIAVAKMLGNGLKLDDEADLAPGQREFLARTRFELARTIFHDPKDLATEFAYRPAGAGNLPASNARYLRNANGQQAYKVRTDKDEGKVLHRQLNHFTRACSAFGYAHLRNLSNIIGKATTGSAESSGGRVHVYLGLNAT